uniref:Uncharacterized protein n=1 Tax=Anguilla anguilla TaxID=7936 RepID=A0A0E9SBK2_ANGAN
MCFSALHHRNVFVSESFKNLVNLTLSL